MLASLTKHWLFITLAVAGSAYVLLQKKTHTLMLGVDGKKNGMAQPR